MAFSQSRLRPGVPWLSTDTTMNPWSAIHWSISRMPIPACTCWCPGPPYTFTITGYFLLASKLRGRSTTAQ
jgi:hypothetical protein